MFKKVKKFFTLVICFIFLFTQTVSAADFICYMPNGPIRSIPQYNPTTGLCETWPLDEYRNCPDGYTYYLWLGTCAALPRCIGNYTYDLGTKSCVPIGAQEENSTSTIPYHNICAIDRNGNGEITLDEMEQCIPADDGSFICPLDAIPCQPKYVIPDCPRVYTYNSQTKTCQADRICPSGGSMQYIDNQTICVTGGIISCSVEYQNGTDNGTQNGTDNGTQNGTDNGTVVCSMICPDGYGYDSKLQACVGSPVCPPGGSFNETAGKCEASPSCPSGSVFTDYGCFVGYFCPYGNYPCKPVNGVMKCSASQCWQRQDLAGDDFKGPGNYEDDELSNATEQCVGPIYIFNGRAQRCRPPGWQVGLFNNCCRSSLAKDKLYDSTGTSKMDLSTIKYAAAAVKYSYDIARFGYLFRQEFINIYVGKDVILLSKTVDFDYRTVVAFSRNSVEGKAMENFLQSRGFDTSPGQYIGIMQDKSAFDATTLDAMTSYVKALGPQIAWTIFHIAMSGMIKDPQLSAIVGLAADAAVFYLQSIGVIKGITLVTPVGLAFATIGVAMSFVFGGGCDKEDVMTVIQRESGRCHYVGERCVKYKKILFKKICVQRGKFYCCFNSKLARIIHEQGRPQLNTDIKSWGSAKHPNCRGFTPEEFASLDFDKIDLSEYINDITRNMNKEVEIQAQRLFHDTIQTQYSY